ncbi:MAG TPA: hypothetical protein VMZ52_19815 [Bryobacteraceae bacterium]|nr:hypothetical protein [Bryobacteraceae bacterium]
MGQIISGYASYAAVGISLILGARLFGSGLASTYRWFTAYLITDFILTVVFYATPYGTNRYALTYFAAQPVRWVLYFGIVLELYRLVLRRHPGIAAFGRKWLIRALGLAALISVCTLFVHLQASRGKYPALETYHTIERLVNICLFIFFFLLLAILAWFPIQLTKNLAVLCSVFEAHILVRTGITIVRNVGGLASLSILNPILACLAPVSMLVVTVLLSPSGEERSLKAGLKRPPAAEKRILAHLDAINDTLSRSSNL